MLRYTDKQLAMAQQCGLAAFCFSKVFILLECDGSQPREQVERDFYNAGTLLNAKYKFGFLAAEAQLMKVLFDATFSNNREVRPFDKAAYDALQLQRAINIEEAQEEERNYWRENVTGVPRIDIAYKIN
jgi:hypothetical protein